MFEWLITSNTFIIILVFGVITVSISLLVYVYARKLIKRYITGDDKKLATMFFSVNASILSLLFSITLFQVRSEHNYIATSLAEELSQLDNVSRNISNLNERNQKKVYPKLHQYLSFMVNKEFNLNITRETVEKSNQLFDDLNNTVMKISATDYEEKQFRNALLRTIDRMGENRGARLFRREAKVSPVFYILMIIFSISLIFLISFERTGVSMIFVAAYSFFCSILLAVIFVSSVFFAGDETTNKEFFDEALRDIEHKMTELDDSIILEKAENIIGTDSTKVE